jgi:hypothetical protein
MESAIQRCHATSWRKADVPGGRELSSGSFSSCPGRFSIKAWYAAFLLLKKLIIGRDVSEAGPALLIMSY